MLTSMGREENRND